GGDRDDAEGDPDRGAGPWDDRGKGSENPGDHQSGQRRDQSGESRDERVALGLARRPIAFEGFGQRKTDQRDRDPKRDASCDHPAVVATRGPPRSALYRDNGVEDD